MSRVDPLSALRWVHLSALCPSYEPQMLDYHESAAQRISELNNDIASHTGEKRMAIHQRTKEPPNADKIGMYKTQMSADEVHAFEQRAGGLLAKLGYSTTIVT